MADFTPYASNPVNECNEKKRSTSPYPDYPSMIPDMEIWDRRPIFRPWAKCELLKKDEKDLNPLSDKKQLDIDLIANRSRDFEGLLTEDSQECSGTGFESLRTDGSFERTNATFHRMSLFNKDASSSTLSSANTLPTIPAPSAQLPPPNINYPLIDNPISMSGRLSDPQLPQHTSQSVLSNINSPIKWPSSSRPSIPDSSQFVHQLSQSPYFTDFERLRTNKLAFTNQVGGQSIMANLSYENTFFRQMIGEKLKKADQQKKQRPKKFQCPHCQVSFTNNGQLKGHIRIHTGERPFKCDYVNCDKTFTRNEELTRHKRIHTGIKPFSCPLCGKSFGRKDHLKKHTRTHQRIFAMSTNILQTPFPPSQSSLLHRPTAGPCFGLSYNSYNTFM